MKTQNTTQENFKILVDEFVTDCCDEYMAKSKVSFDFSDPDDPGASIELEDLYRNSYEVPIRLYDGLPSIDIGIGGALDLSLSGLYCFLWHVAAARRLFQEILPFKTRS